MLVLLLIISLSSSSPFHEVLEGFDVPLFTQKALGKTYSSLNEPMKQEFQRVIHEHLRTHLVQAPWQSKSEWKISSQGLATTLLHPRYEEVNVEVIKSSTTGKFLDIQFDDSSMLTAVAASLRKYLRLKTPKEVLAKLKTSLQKKNKHELLLR